MSLRQVVFRNKSINSFLRLTLVTCQNRTISAFNDNCQIYQNEHFNSSNHLLRPQSNLNIVKRFKKQSKVEKILEEIKEMEQEDESSDEDSDDEDDGQQSKVNTYKVNSLRIDTIAKLVSGLTRNKVEKAFYEGKIYLNGQQVLKKSVDVQKNDVVDFIKGKSPNDENKVLVARATMVNWQMINLGYKIQLAKEQIHTDKYKLEEF